MTPWATQTKLLASAVRAMFQFVLAEGEDVDEKLRRLEEQGVALDRRFGAILVSPAQKKYVSRGEADDETRQRLRDAGEFEVYGDVRVEATKQTPDGEDGAEG